MAKTKTKTVKEKTPKVKKANAPGKQSGKKFTKTAGFKALVACIMIVVVGGGVAGGLWLGGVFEPKNAAAVNFLSTLQDMKTEKKRELVGAYQGDDGNVHLVYKNGAVKSMFVQLLTVPELRTNLNSGGQISFTKGEVTSKTMGEALSESVTTVKEHTAGTKIGIEYQSGAVTDSIAKYKYSMELSYEFKTSKSSTYEKSNYTEVGESISVEETHSNSLSDCKAGYYYAYALYADFDVFTDVGVIIGGPDDLQIASVEACFALQNKRPSIVFVESETNDFNVPLDLTVEKLPLTGYIDKYEIFGEGDGSLANPYLIYAPSQLMYIALKPSACYKLAQDVSLKGWQWRNNFTFNGALDGGGKTIWFLENTEAGGALDADRYYGLFSQTGAGSSIKNLTLSDCSIVRTSNGAAAHNGTGTMYAGILVGYGKGAIENITVRRTDPGKSTVEVHRYRSAIGGIAGLFESGTIKNCRSQGVMVKGNGDMGILVGHLRGGIINNCTVGSFIQQDYSDVMSTVAYHCYGEARAAGGMAGVVSDKGADKSRVENGAVNSIDFIFSGGDNNNNLNPRIGYVAGELQGAINKVAIPADITIRALQRLFEGFDLNRSTGSIRYFFGAGSYYAGDRSDRSWGWFDDWDQNLSSDSKPENNRPIEAGMRVDDWYITRPDGWEF